MGKRKILLTGSSGLLGHYFLQLLKDDEVITLGRGEEADIKCDLEKETPRFTEDFPDGFDMVIHAAGTQEEGKALALNLEGSRRLLEGLKGIPVKQFVYISSTDVYGKKEGEGIKESDHLWTADKAGQSKVLAEQEITKYCDEKGIILTILRPAPMFGKGMKGWGERMAAQVLSGYYLNIRDNDANVSIVLAYDVARAALALANEGGVYNVTDMRDHSLQALAMAMGNNGGKAKKPFFLPMKWAKIAARIGEIAGLGKVLMDREELRRRTSSLTFSVDKLKEKLPEFRPFDTAAVIGREDKDFPYEDD